MLTKRQTHGYNTNFGSNMNIIQLSMRERSYGFFLYSYMRDDSPMIRLCFCIEWNLKSLISCELSSAGVGTERVYSFCVHFDIIRRFEECFEFKNRIFIEKTRRDKLLNKKRLNVNWWKIIFWFCFVKLIIIHDIHY